MRYLRYLYVPLACCAAGLVIVLGLQGLSAAWVTLVLLLLEISLSFDNAVVNARVLDQLTPGQQRFFLTWGLVIPVFGVRFAGPLLMVALAGGVGVGQALDAALHLFYQHSGVHKNDRRNMFHAAGRGKSNIQTNSFGFFSSLMT